VILPVTEIDRAAAVYAEVLGDAGERVSPGRHYFNCGGTILACYDSQADGDGPAHAPRYQPELYIYFSVPDLDATHETASRLDTFQGSNPYRLTEISDRFGIHSRLENTPVEEPKNAPISKAYWFFSDQRVSPPARRRRLRAAEPQPTLR
jgi:hypothetical protein